MSIVRKEQPADVSGGVAHEEGRSLGWWGMVFFIASEALLFANLIAAYLYLRVRQGTWPPAGYHLGDIWLPAINTVILLSSSIPMHLAGRAAARGQMRLVPRYILFTILLGVAFLSMQAIEYGTNTFGIKGNLLGSTFYTLTGFHGAHVTAGIILLLVNFFRATRGQLTKEKHFSLVAGEMYWHFVDVVWIFLFSLVYLISL